MDIETIKKKLKNYEEITDVFDLKYMSDLKYITLTKEGDEQFYEGGKYLRMGDNKILIKRGYISIYIPIEYRLKDGQVYYRTRFFMKEHLQMTQKNFNELLEVVDSQQQVINKLFKKTKKYEKLLGI